MSERIVGTIKIYDRIKGYGFITRKKGKDVMVHFSEFADKNGDGLVFAGCEVEFELDLSGSKGPRAKKVKVIG